MILLLNLSVEPFFVGILNSSGEVLHQQSLANDKTVGKCLFDFLEIHRDLLPKLDWVGGVTGPGGFATLRVAASFLTTVSEVQNVPIRSATAFEWVGEWLRDQPYDRAVLNSFSGQVFLVPTTLKLRRTGETDHDTSPAEAYNKPGRLIPLTSIPDLKNCWYGALPEKKRVETYCNASPDASSESMNIESLYKICIQKEGTRNFEPEYCFEAVET